ncbi:MAG: YkgJ family cysteine cluster protein [Magnetococcus sp. MYC-9]
MSSRVSNEDRERVLQLDPEMRDMPREVRNVISPVRLTGKDLLQFRCHPGISCFNQCCRHIEILLTPYDLLRLRQRLRMTAEAFLYQYATPYTLTKGQLPVAMLRMDEETGQCPFVTPEGCSVYSDRPVTCRHYPLGLALLHRQQAAGDETFYFLIKEEYCQGHQEEKQWQVDEWRQDQGSDGYDERNRKWMELIVKRRSAGDATSTSLPVSEFFYMASTNPEKFRQFVFNSSFLKRYQVDEETAARLREDDEAMTEFALSWLKSVLFGDEEVKVRPEAFAALRTRKSEAG